MQPSAVDPNEAEWKWQKHCKWIPIKIIAIALRTPSIKAIFFNIVSVFRDISEGRNNLKIEFKILSIKLNSV